MTPGRPLAYIAYAGLSALVAPALVRRDAAKLDRQGVPPERRRERLGHATRPRPAGRLVWIHAVSVGEALSALPLIRALVRDSAVLLTTTSATSADLIADKLPKGAMHQFAPIDAPGPVRRFFDHWRPWCFVLTESELWPRQIATARARGCPVVLINGRLSDRSLRRWSKLRPLAGFVMDRVALAMTQDERTRDGLVALGLPAARAEVAGTLKSAAPPLDADRDALTALAVAIGDRPVWVAASTHEGEEEAISTAHRRLVADRADLLLILAPRHPDRADAIADALAKDGWRVARRSAGDLPGPETGIYLADTLGEMGLWFRLAPVAFIGGSLVDRGGHNPIEPVQLGAYAVTGPHIANFESIYAPLLAAGAATRIDTACGLAPAIAAGLGAERPAEMPEGTVPDPFAMAARLAPLCHDPADPRIVAPNLKRRLSGVTATVVRLIPLQAARIAIRTTGPGLPPHVPHLPLARVARLPRTVPRVWHARRNSEMILGLALRTALRKNWRLVFTSASQRNHTRLTKWLIARMDAVVATSDRSGAYLERPHRVVRHGIDTETFRPASDKPALRRRLGLPVEARLVGCFGRIRDSKGTDLFVDAMLGLLTSYPGAVGLVMGRATSRDRAFAAALRDRVAGSALSHRLRFLDEVATHETPDFYAALDLYVAPQRWEGFGLTPLEAMASGVPVVATRVGAFEELVVDGETGRLVPPGDAVALGDAIGALLSDREGLEMMGIAARDHVARHFTLDAEAEALIVLYEELLASPSRLSTSSTQ